MLTKVSECVPMTLGQNRKIFSLATPLAGPVCAEPLPFMRLWSSSSAGFGDWIPFEEAAACFLVWRVDMICGIRREKTASAVLK